MSGKVSYQELEEALRESVQLQSHYAELLNMYDGGKRMTFTVESWIARLKRMKGYLESMSK